MNKGYGAVADELNSILKKSKTPPASRSKYHTNCGRNKKENASSNPQEKLTPAKVRDSRKLRKGSGGSKTPRGTSRGSRSKRTGLLAPSQKQVGVRGLLVVLLRLCGTLLGGQEEGEYM